MKLPKFITNNSVIGVCAPSNGVYFGCEKTFQNAITTFNGLGHKVIVQKDIYNSKFAVSGSVKKRADEFTKLWLNEKIEAIIAVSGGERMLEILPYLNANLLKSVPPKFFQGYSDNTVLTHYLATTLDIAGVYGYLFYIYGMEKWHSSLIDSYNFLLGKKTNFNSFKTYESDRPLLTSDEILKGFKLNKPASWENINCKNVEITGRLIGGCLDILTNYCGTVYDNTVSFLEKYKSDGFIWYFDIFDMNSAQVIRALWQLNYAGWFKYAKGFIFGRVNNFKQIYEIDFIKSLAPLKELNLPIIINADIGHKFPVIPIFNGVVATVTSNAGKGNIKYFI